MKGTYLLTDSVDLLIRLIENNIGIRYSKENFYQIESRLQTLFALSPLKSIDEVISALQNQNDSSLKTLILDSFTNNETSFFRDPRIFKMMSSTLLPQLIAQSHNQLKIWCMASSTGQEVYSMLILLHQMKRNLKFEFDIFATDVSRSALDRARQGSYTELEIQRGLTSEIISEFFDKRTDRWVFKESLKRNVTFKNLNLLFCDEVQEKFDLILCRNVLIYFDPQKKELVLNQILKNLNPNAKLVLGCGESVVGLKTDFEVSTVDGLSLYSKNKNSFFKKAGSL